MLRRVLSAFSIIALALVAGCILADTEQAVGEDEEQNPTYDDYRIGVGAKIISAAVHPSQPYVAVVTDNDSMSLWNYATRQKLLSVAVEAVRAEMRFSDTCDRLFMKFGSAEGDMSSPDWTRTYHAVEREYDAQTLDLMSQEIGPDYSVGQVCGFGPNGSYAVTTAYSSICFEGRPIIGYQRPAIHRADGTVDSLDFTVNPCARQTMFAGGPAGTWFALRYADNLAVWDAATGSRLIFRQVAPSLLGWNPVESIASSGDGTAVFSSSHYQVYRTNIQTGATDSVASGSFNTAYFTAAGPGHDLVAVTSDILTVVVRFSDASVLRTFAGLQDRSLPYVYYFPVGFSNDARWLIAADADSIGCYGIQ